MTKSKALAKTSPAALATEWTKEQVDLIKSMVAVGATDNELKLFLYTAARTGLDPLTKQIYCIKRGGKMTIQTGIDGYRAVAVRTGELAGIEDSVFDREDGTYPNKATVTVHRIVKGQKCSFTASARWSEYVQTFNGQPGGQWAKMPFLMLAKCAEALALRKAFPNDLSGIYTHEEMGQAENAPAAPMSGSVEIEEQAPPATAPIEGEVVQEKPLTKAARQMNDGRAAAAANGALRRCPFCDKQHTGAYDKCRECWKAEKDGATLTPAAKKKTIVNHDAPPFP